MESFKRLNTKITANDYDILSSRIKFGETINHEFKGIEYFNINYKDVESLLQIIPYQHRNNFCLTLMRINTEVPPHTDTGINTTINFYLQTGDYITQFYNIKTNNPKTNQVDNQTNGFIFDKHDLIESGSFTAGQNDVWILDVTKPHSVIPKDTITERIGLSLATNSYSYDDVCNMLIETGNL